MNKIFTFLFLTILTASIWSCQDEFCLDATTPELIISFYNNDDKTTKKPLEITVWVNNLDTIYNGSTTDSISIPLNTQKNTVTYHLSQSNSIEDITINYTTEDIFVSKSCGYKSIFNNLATITNNNDWLKDSEVITTSITNETQAHVKIYH